MINQLDWEMAIKITEESVEEIVTELVVENSVGRRKITLTGYICYVETRPGVEIAGTARKS